MFDDASDRGGGGADPEEAMIGAAIVVLESSNGAIPTNSEIFELLARTLGLQAVRCGAPSGSEATEAARSFIEARMEIERKEPR